MNKELRFHISIWGILGVYVIVWATVGTIMAITVPLSVGVPLWSFPLIWLGLCAFASSVILLADWGMKP